MKLDSAIKYVKDNINVYHNFIFHGSRNQNDEFRGKITKSYSYVFIIELENGQIRSYSYSDLIIHNLEIID